MEISPLDLLKDEKTGKQSSHHSKTNP